MIVHGFWAVARASRQEKCHFMESFCNDGYALSWLCVLHSMQYTRFDTLARTNLLCRKNVGTQWVTVSYSKKQIKIKISKKDPGGHLGSTSQSAQPIQPNSTQKSVLARVLNIFEINETFEVRSESKRILKFKVQICSDLEF